MSEEGRECLFRNRFHACTSHRTPFRTPGASCDARRCIEVDQADEWTAAVVSLHEVRTEIRHHGSSDDRCGHGVDEAEEYLRDQMNEAHTVTGPVTRRWSKRCSPSAVSSSQEKCTRVTLLFRSMSSPKAASLHGL